jgi:hypothetical protein
MAYEKHIIRREKDAIIKQMAFCGKYNRGHAQCLKKQQIWLLPNYIKRISRGVSYVCSCM